MTTPNQKPAQKPLEKLRKQDPEEMTMHDLVTMQCLCALIQSAGIYGKCHKNFQHSLVEEARQIADAFLIQRETN